MIQDNTSIRPLSAVLRKRAEEELNETPEKIVSHLKMLQDWIKTQPDLKNMKTTNQWLIAFLRGCKYDVEKAKGKIKMYTAHKANIPEFYGKRDPFDPDLQEILKLGSFLPLRKTMSEDAPRVCISRIGPYSLSIFYLGSFLPLHKTMSEDAPRVCISRIGPYSLSKQRLVDFLKVTLMIMEILLIEDDHFVVAGQDSVCDLKGMGFSFIMQWTPFVAKKAMTCMEKTLSGRITKIQMLYPPNGFSYALVILKLFMTAKAKNRIHLHNKIDHMYEHIDKSILPEEYGGTDGKLQDLIDYWKEKVESYRDWFVEENNEDSK